MDYFTVRELYQSSEAKKQGIDNTPTPDAKVKLRALIINTLNPIRELWGKPVTVNSGYRCPYLNKVVGGVPSSQHIKGEAADITAGTRDDNRRLFDMICKSGIPFDQLIDEKGYAWLHISFSADRNRRQILHLK
jgi:hypothetical protein